MKKVVLFVMIVGIIVAIGVKTGIIQVGHQVDA